LAGALGIDAGQHLGELVALEYDGYQFAREFSPTEGATRGIRGHLGHGGRDQRGFVAVIMVLELGQAWDPGCG
jgi:hypothetical protein